jgi:hypothetical protein
MKGCQVPEVDQGKSELKAFSIVTVQSPTINNLVPIKMTVFVLIIL